MILLLALLINTAHAQTLTWSASVEIKKEDGSTIPAADGYKILYGISAEHNDCSGFSKSKRPPYSVDVGPVLKYSLRSDPNFQPGVSYFVAVISYKLNPLVINNEQVGWSANESLIKESACVTIRGLPEGTEFENVYDDEYVQQTNEGDKDEEISVSVGHPDESVSDSGSSGVHMDGAASKHEQRGAKSASGKVQSILGDKLYGNRPIGSDRNAATSYFNRRSDRSKDVSFKNVKSVVAGGNKNIFPNDSSTSITDRRRSGISKVSRSGQANAKQPKITDKRNGSVGYILSALVIGIGIFLGIKV